MTALVSREEAVRHFRRASRSMNTRKAYASDWAIWERWCVENECNSLPSAPSALELFVVDMAGRGLKTATIARRVATIGAVHRKAGCIAPNNDEGFKATLAGIRREKGGDRTPKTPLLVEDVHRIGYALAGTVFLRDKRDIALVALGFAGAFRQSELTALNIEDIEEVPGGIRVRIRRSKIDQEGEGEFVGIPTGRVTESCPVLALKDYVSEAKIISGSIFRRFRKGDLILTQRLKPEAVNATVKRLVSLIGKDPHGYGGHSLRAGLATCAAMNGATLSEIAQQGRWKSSDTVLNHYIRPANLLSERNAAAVAGL